MKGLTARLFLSASLAVTGAAGLGGCDNMTPRGRIGTIRILVDGINFMADQQEKQRQQQMQQDQQPPYQEQPQEYSNSHRYTLPEREDRLLFNPELGRFIVCNEWIDSNGDGVIDSEELSGGTKRLFRSGETLTLIATNVSSVPMRTQFKIHLKHSGTLVEANERLIPPGRYFNVSYPEPSSEIDTVYLFVDGRELAKENITILP